MDLHKFLQKINRENIIDTTLLEYLHIKSRCNKRIVEDYELIYNVASEVFDPDQFDIQLYYTANQSGFNVFEENIIYAELHFSLALVIKFDDITITNSNHNRANLKDMYVMLLFNHSEKLSLITMYGFRGALNDIEATERYMHSHLKSFMLSISGMSYHNPFPFCFGTDEIKILIIKLKDHFDKNLFKLFLFQIEPFLSWESLEGTPYMKIANLFRKSTIKVHMDIDMERVALAINDNIDTIIENHDEFKYDLSTQRYAIVDNNSLYRMLLNMFPQYTIYLDDAGNEYLTSSEITETNNLSMYKGKNFWYIPFKGQEIEIRVFKAERVITEPIRAIYRPAFEFMIKVIDTLINKKLLKYYVDKRKATTV